MVTVAMVAVDDEKDRSFGLERAGGNAKGWTAAIRAARDGSRRRSPNIGTCGASGCSARTIARRSRARSRARPDATGGAAGERRAWGAHPASHVLLAPLDAMGAARGNPGARRACGPDDDPALDALEPGSPRRGDQPAGTAVRRSFARLRRNSALPCSVDAVKDAEDLDARTLPPPVFSAREPGSAEPERLWWFPCQLLMSRRTHPASTWRVHAC